MSDVVLVSLEPWDDVWRRNQHLVAGLLRSDQGLRVLFVEPPVDPLHDLSRRARPRRGRGTRPGPVLDEVGPDRLWLHEPTKLLPRRWDPSSDRRWARGVQRAARRLQMSSPVLWVNSLQGVHVLDASRWAALYDITDDWLLAERSAAEQQRLRDEEARLLAEVRSVVVCSQQLATTKTHPDLTVIPNAVDLARYRTQHPRPADLPEGPVAVYVGTVHADRFDVDLTERLARRVDGIARVVLVGPALLRREDTARLERAGVLLLGGRPFTEVPAYLQHADVLLVPHVVSPFTESLDPIKVYEYQAARRPVVSTPVAGFRDTEDPAVRAVSPEEFPEEVRRLLVDPPGELGPAQIPTWDDRVAALRTVLARVAVSG